MPSFGLNLNAQTDDHNLKFKKKGDELFKVVKNMPKFPGCKEVEYREEKKKCSNIKILEYVYANLQYPASAREKSVEGRAIFQFVVQKDGTIGDIKYVRNPGEGIGEAAMDVMSLMNEEGIIWNTGTQRGKNVHVLYTLPVLFRVEKDRKAKSSAKNNTQIKISKDALDKSTPKGSEIAPPPPSALEKVFKVV